jgi:hypothetical protein
VNSLLLHTFYCHDVLPSPWVQNQLSQGLQTEIMH